MQADSEERLEADMVSHNADFGRERGASDSRKQSKSYTVKSMTRNGSTTSVGKVSKNLKTKESLFNLEKKKTEIAVQTDGEGSLDRSHLKSRGTNNRGVRIDESDAGYASLDKTAIDPDKYKEDWTTSLCYKKAMKVEAIRRGVHVDSEFEVDEEDERVAMTVTNFDANTNLGGGNKGLTADNSLDFGNQF